MSERIGVIIDDWVQQATLSSAPTAVATLPAQYLKTELHAEVMRVMGDSVTLTIEFPAPQQIDAAVLCWHNLSNAAVVSVDLVDVHDNVLQSINAVIKPSITAYFPTQSVAKLIWHITDIGVEFVQVGRAIAGLMWQPVYGVDNGIGWEWEDGTDQVRSKGGAIHYRLRQKYKRQTVNFHNLSTAEALRLYNVQRGVGMFVSVYKDWGTSLEVAFEGMYSIADSIKPTHDYNDVFGCGVAWTEA